MFLLLAGTAKRHQGFLRVSQHTVVRVMPRPVQLASRHPGQQFDSFGNVFRGMNMKAPLCNRLHQMRRQHQMALIAPRDQHALAAIQPGVLADAEPALYFFVEPAHWQHFAVLVDCAGDGNALLSGRPDKADNTT